MSEKIGAATANRQADSLGSTFYGGGTLKIYSGSQPATADTGATGTLIVTITLPATPFGAAVAGVASKSGTWSGSAVASNTAGWFRIQTSGNTHPMDGEVTATGGGGEIELDSTTITSGQTVTINTFTLTQPES